MAIVTSEIGTITSVLIVVCLMLERFLANHQPFDLRNAALWRFFRN